MFVGRSREFRHLDDLLANARRGRSGVLVLRGEPGVGKTRLLESLVASAAEWRILRTVGVESEAELAFAALHQLCTPLLGHLDQLPAPQRDALSAAFGLRAGNSPERFLVGLATLSLLSATAEEQPVICIVDDAQWLDVVSAQALAFVARRLLTDPIVMLFATREHRDELEGLPEMFLEGLADEDAGALLSSVVEGPLNPEVRNRIIAQTRGNPLALIELPRGLTPAELAVGFVVPVELALSTRIEQTFAARIQRLPLDTQKLLVIAAADQLGEAAKVWRAAELVGVGRDALRPAEEAELLEMDVEVRFRHPLVRSSAYRGASFGDRRMAHQALADATDPVADPDRRAWHLAAAAIGPDEEVAAELERSAGRAHERGGMAAAAAFLERSARLTPDPERQALRRLLAAAAYLQAGTIDRAQEQLALTEGQLTDPLSRAQAMRIDGALRFAVGRGRDTPSLLFDAARVLRDLDHRLGNETMMEAVEAAMWAGHLGSGATVIEIAEAVSPWFAPEEDRDAADEDSTASLLLRAYSLRVRSGYPAAVEWWRRAVTTGARDVTGLTRLQLQGMLWNATGDMLDFENHMAVARDRVRQAREQGALATLPVAVVCLAWCELLAGNIEAAEALNAEGMEIAAATGLPEFPGAHGIIRLGILSWRGLETEVGDLAKAVVSEALEQGQGLTVNIADMCLAKFELGRGRYEEARSYSLKVFEADPWYVGSLGLADLIEAAWRCDDSGSAAAGLERLSERAEASGSPWGLGLLARGRAMTGGDEDAEILYQESIEQLTRAGVRTEVARSHLLYGEWLRRQRRRRDARETLRAAHALLVACGGGAFARRAEAELLATGEHARTRVDQTRNELTAQELQVAHLAAEGESNAEIAAQLYISPHTVSHHLRRVFTKLEVRSRTQLVNVLARSESA